MDMPLIVRGGRKVYVNRDKQDVFGLGVTHDYDKQSGVLLTREEITRLRDRITELLNETP